MIRVFGEWEKRLRAGQVVGGRYRLEELLGAGSQGEVWRAADLRLSERAVALKRALVAGDPVAAQKVRREAETLARVNHPHVVTVYDTEDEDGDCWIVMEYVSGRTLADLATISAEDAARYGAQLAGGLEAAHAAGILHRDIKPANVLVTDGGYAKLADFGIARRVHAEPTLTGTGAVTGTPGYVAPEVVRGGKYTAAADVFSLGATLFHAVEGTSPFGEGNAHALLWRTAQGDRVEATRAGTLAPVLDRLLETDPKRRIKIDAARLALGRLSGEAVVGAPRRSNGGRRWVWAGAAAAALVVLAAAVWPSLRDSESDPAGPQEDSPTWTTGDLIGDPATLDPCALIDEERLSAFGETGFDLDNGGFERCDLRIDNDDGGADLSMYLYETTGDELDGEVTMVGSIGVVQSGSEYEWCERLLILPDGEHFVNVYAEQDPGDDADDMCPLVDAAVDGAIAVLQAGEIPRREREEDAVSTFYLDTCAMLDDEALEAFPGIDANHPLEGFGGWDCKWFSTTSDSNLRIRFDRDDPPEADDGQRIELDGRTVYIEGDHWGEESCLVSVIHREFTSANLNGTVTAEYVRIIVSGEDPVEDLCDLAVAIAGPVAEALPEV